MAQVVFGCFLILSAAGMSLFGGYAIMDLMDQEFYLEGTSLWLAFAVTALLVINCPILTTLCAIGATVQAWQWPWWLAGLVFGWWLAILLLWQRNNASPFYRLNMLHFVKGVLGVTLITHMARQVARSEQSLRESVPGFGVPSADTSAEEIPPEVREVFDRMLNRPHGYEDPEKEISPQEFIRGMLDDERELLDRYLPPRRLPLRAALKRDIIHAAYIGDHVRLPEGERLKAMAAYRAIVDELMQFDTVDIDFLFDDMKGRREDLPNLEAWVRSRNQQYDTVPIIFG